MERLSLVLGCNTYCPTHRFDSNTGCARAKNHNLLS